MGVWNRVNWDLLDDFDVIGLKSDHFAWIVRKETDFVNAEVSEDLGTEPVVTQIHRETEFFICFDGIEALFLEFVSADFWAQPDAPAFLTHVE